MITRDEQREAQAYAAGQLAEAGIELTTEERRQIEVADFGLGELRKTGLLVFTDPRIVRAPRLADSSAE